MKEESAMTDLSDQFGNPIEEWTHRGRPCRIYYPRSGSDGEEEHNATPLAESDFDPKGWFGCTRSRLISPPLEERDGVACIQGKWIGLEINSFSLDGPSNRSEMKVEVELLANQLIAAENRRIR